MSNDANEDPSDGSHYDEGEGCLDLEEINLANVEELQSQIDELETIENPLEKEMAVNKWVENLNE